MGTRVEGRRETDFPHPTAGGGGRGKSETPGPSAHCPSPPPCLPCGSAPGGMVDSGACQRRVCGLKPRPALANFPFSLHTPPTRFPFQTSFPMGMEEIWFLNSQISQMCDSTVTLLVIMKVAQGTLGAQSKQCEITQIPASPFLGRIHRLISESD